MVSSFFHHGDGAPQWRGWGPPTAPIPVPRRPYSGLRFLRMYIKAVQRAEAIGGFGGDELVISICDMVKKHRKSLVVSWLYSFLKTNMRVTPAPILTFLAKTQKNDSHFSLKGTLTSKLILTFHFKSIICLLLVHSGLRVKLAPAPADSPLAPCTLSPR